MIVPYISEAKAKVLSFLNLGSGAQVWKETTNDQVRMRSIIATTPLVATQNADDVTITAPNLVTGRNSSGLITNPKVWIGTVASSGGTFTIDMTSAGFSSPPLVVVSVNASHSNVYDRSWATVSGVTSTSVAGYVIRGASLLALGATVRTAVDGTNVTVIAIGN